MRHDALNRKPIALEQCVLRRRTRMWLDSCGVALLVAQAHATEFLWTNYRVPSAVFRTDATTLATAPVIPSGLTAPYRVSFDPGDQKLYWTTFVNGGPVYRANLDGSGIETVAPSSGPWPSLGLAIDSASRKLYWTRGNIVYRSNLDGSGAQAVVVPDTTVFQDITFDAQAQKLYLSDATLQPGTLGRVRRMNADLSGITDVVTSIEAGPVGLGVESGSGKLYWGSFRSGASTAHIERANLDGSARELVLSGVDVDAFSLDSAGGKMYWTTYEFGTRPGTISRANLDGTAVEVLPLGTIFPAGVTVIPEPAAGTLLLIAALIAGRSRFRPRRRTTVG